MDLQVRALLDIQRESKTQTSLVNHKDLNWDTLDSTVVYDLCLVSFISSALGLKISLYGAEQYFKNGRFGCYYTVLGESHLIPDDYLYGFVPTFR